MSTLDHERILEDLQEGLSGATPEERVNFLGRIDRVLGSETLRLLEDPDTRDLGKTASRGIQQTATRLASFGIHGKLQR